MDLSGYLDNTESWELEPNKNWRENYLFWSKKYISNKINNLSKRFLIDSKSFELTIQEIDFAENMNSLKDEINNLSKLKVKGAKSYFIAIYKFYLFLEKVKTNKISEIENMAIKAFIISLENEVSNITKSNMIIRVKNFLKFISENNTDKFDFKITITPKEMVKNDRKIVEVISPDKEYSLFLKGIDEFNFKFNNTRNKLLLKIALYTGMRVSEITYLKYKDIKIENNFFAFHITGKGNKKRTLYIEKKNILSLWDLYLKETSPKDKKPDSYVFCNRYSEPLADRTVSNYVRKILEFKNIKTTKTGLHIARHSLATKLLFSGEHSIEDISALLGHEDISTTQIYTHITNEHIKKTSKGISSVINKDYKKSKDNKKG